MISTPLLSIAIEYKGCSAFGDPFRHGMRFGHDACLALLHKLGCRTNVAAHNYGIWLQDPTRGPRFFAVIIESLIQLCNSVLFCAPTKCGAEGRCCCLPLSTKRFFPSTGTFCHSIEFYVYAVCSVHFGCTQHSMLFFAGCVLQSAVLTQMHESSVIL